MQDVTINTSAVLVLSYGIEMVTLGYGVELQRGVTAWSYGVELRSRVTD